MKKIYDSRILTGLLMLLMAAFWTSCSEDTIGTETNESKLSSVTFHIEGIEGLRTRAANGIENIDFNKYGARLYLFKDKIENSTTDTDNPYPGFTLASDPVEITEGYVTIDNLNRTEHNYIYIIVAYEKGYAEEAKVMSWDADSYASYELEVDKSLYTTCYIAALDENNSYAPYSQQGDDKFMIYGAGGEIASQLDQFVPVEVVLTRQMGAVVFSTGAENIEQISASCTISTDYYRLYLSQIIETLSGTQNHCSDFASSNANPEISIEFDGGALINELKGYMVYLPCTTTKTYESYEALNIPDREKINYLSYEGVDQPKTGTTSITVQEKTYATNQLFPIYPNRRTILTIGDGSKITVSFGDDKGNINQEGDWNGGL